MRGAGRQGESSDLERWRLFVLVADLGSLSKAAAVIDRPQSVISRQLAALEEACGASLFYRTGRGVLPTELGTEVLPRVRALLATHEQLWADVRGHAGVAVGRVSVGLLPSINIAPELVRLCAGQYPAVRLHLTEASTGALAEQIALGKVDLALMLRDPDNLPASEALVARLPAFLVGPPGDPLTAGPTVPFRNLDRLPLVMARSPNAFRLHIEQTAARLGLTLEFPIEADALVTQKALVAAGHGWAITSAIGARGEVAEGRLQAARLVEPGVALAIVLGSSTQRPATLAIRKVAALLRDLCRGIGEG